MLYIHLPNVPISHNAAYESITKKGKGQRRITVRRLSDAGKKYKNEVKAHIIKHYATALDFFVPNQPYAVFVELVFQGRGKVYTESWLEEGAKKAKNRYKKLDVSNRLKLFEDALAEAVGIDDCHNFFVGVVKTWARDYEATNVWIFNREADPDNPVDALLRHLKSAV